MKAKLAKVGIAFNGCNDNIRVIIGGRDMLSHMHRQAYSRRRVVPPPTPLAAADAARRRRRRSSSSRREREREGERARKMERAMGRWITR
jgi:hypothetical protein